MMRDNKIIIVGFLLSTLVVSCSQSEPKKVSANKNLAVKQVESVDETSVGKSKLDGQKKVEKKKEHTALLGKRTVSFNGEKYLFDGRKLQQGSKVRGIHMSESGRVKGSIVVVVKEGKILDISFMNFKSKTKIAKNTFRLIPNQTDDLLTVYKKLSSNNSISIAELEIVYGKKGGDR